MKNKLTINKIYEYKRSFMYRVLVGEYIDDEAIANLQLAYDVEADIKIGIKREELLNIIHEYDALNVRSVIQVND